MELGTLVTLSCAFIEKITIEDYKFYENDHLYLSPSTTLISFKECVVDHFRQRHDLDIRVSRICKVMDANISFLRQSVASVERQLGNVTEFVGGKVQQFLDFETVDVMETAKDRIIVIFTIGKAVKRPHDLSELDVHERMKRTKLTEYSPSEIGKLSAYIRLQISEDEKILDDRPSPDAGVPPLPLLYDGFGYFLDFMDGLDDTLLENVDQLTLACEVENFANKMTQYYPDKDSRRSAAIPALNAIFSAYQAVELPLLKSTDIGSIKTDDYSRTESGIGVTFTSFENDSADGMMMPEPRAACSFAHLNKHDQLDHRRRCLYLGWRIPALAITVVGSSIRFYAMIAVDHRVRQASLTPAISCFSSASDGRQRTLLHRAFTAAVLLQVRILQDSQRLLRNLPPKIPTETRLFPAVSRLMRHKSDDSFLSFEIGRLGIQRSNSFLYLALTDNIARDLILIKFVRRYSTELHDFCSNAGRAPKLLAFQRLPGGWYGVAMEFIDDLEMITDRRVSEKRTIWKEQIEELVAGFHEQGLVHGDLRDVNIMCKDDSVVLLDFDWGGEDGEALYPTPNLNPELLEGRTSKDLRIRKEDDDRILRNTLAKLG